MLPSAAQAFVAVTQPLLSESNLHGVPEWCLYPEVAGCSQSAAADAACTSYSQAGMLLQCLNDYHARALNVQIASIQTTWQQITLAMQSSTASYPFPYLFSGQLEIALKGYGNGYGAVDDCSVKVICCQEINTVAHRGKRQRGKDRCLL